MNRSTSVALDGGAFYASKTVALPGSFGGNVSGDSLRVLWGWLPEERVVDPNTGGPWGWAGALSFPRAIIPFEEDGVWRLRTPPVESALAALRMGASHRQFTGVVVHAPSQQESAAAVA